MPKPPYLEEDFNMKGYKLKNHTCYKAKNLSFFASIFSLFIYICVFYVFDLSPYTLFNNNIFWFFMSNTLILIIAADYEAFSSSKQKQQDLYEEYVKHSTQAKSNHVTPYVVPPTSYAEQLVVHHKQCIATIPKQELGGQKKKESIFDQNSDQNTIPEERVLEIVAVQNQPKKLISDDCTNEKKPMLHMKEGDDCYYKEGDQYDEKATFPARIDYRRSKSDRYNRAKHVVINGERVNSVRRSETMKVEPKVVEEENEFSRMTNEDLNRRVEEFIQKFNRQMRLQATRNV